MVRGTAHNPDSFFQARETVNPFYNRVPAIVKASMEWFAQLTGRHYRLFDYDGPADAERVALSLFRVDNMTKRLHRLFLEDAARRAEFVG